MSVDHPFSCFDVQALAKYAFGLGVLQMLLCTAAFSLFSLPVGNGVGTQILEKVGLFVSGVTP